MKWPERVQAIVVSLTHGISHGADDEVRRGATLKIAQQCRFELGPRWGHKRADPGRPPSADVFAYKDEAIFVGWDWSVPSGVANFPESIDLSGQVFIEVEPVNHLNIETGPVTPPGDTNDDTILDALAELKKTLSAVQAELARLDILTSNLEIDRLAHIRDIQEIKAELAKPLRVEGKTNNRVYHDHVVNLEVKRG